jgi:hypothetical protein
VDKKLLCNLPGMTLLNSFFLLPAGGTERTWDYQLSQMWNFIERTERQPQPCQPPGMGSLFQKTSYTDWGKPQKSLAISILQNILLHLFCTSNEGEKVVSLWAECKKCNMGLCTVAYKTTKQNWNPDISTKGRSSELQNLLLHKYVIRQVCCTSSNMKLNKHMDTKIRHIAATSIRSLTTEVFLHGVLLK